MRYWSYIHAYTEYVIRFLEFSYVHQASRIARVTAGLAESYGSLPPGLWLTSPADWLPRTGITPTPNESGFGRRWDHTGERILKSTIRPQFCWRALVTINGHHSRSHRSQTYKLDLDTRVELQCQISRSELVSSKINCYRTVTGPTDLPERLK